MYRAIALFCCSFVICYSVTLFCISLCNEYTFRPDPNLTEEECQLSCEMSCGYVNIMNQSCNGKQYFYAIGNLSKKENCTFVYVDIFCSNNYSGLSFKLFGPGALKYIGENKDNETEIVISKLRMEKNFSRWYYGGKGIFRYHLVSDVPRELNQLNDKICSVNWHLIEGITVAIHFIMAIHCFCRPTIPVIVPGVPEYTWRPIIFF